jgi:molecular chaperone GrpE
MSWKLYGRPTDGAGAPPETGVPEGAVAEGEESGDPTARLQAEIEALKTDRAEWQDRFLRKAAEFDNYRKRMEREKAETAAHARSTVLTELLSILDACERALGSFAGVEEAESLKQYREGVELLYKQLNDTLARMGVAPIEALGEKFDPHLHEALIREETAAQAENTVLEVLRRGYMLKDRLLRPAQVKVAVRPPA